MALPTTREEFKQICLRNLGKPVIKINVADIQIEDQIDLALSYYYDYHYDGSEKIYYKHQITQQDKDNGYIILPENIIGAVRIFDVSSTFGGNGNMFDVRYQFMMNELYTLASGSLAPYVMAFTNLQMMEQILIGKQPIRYNRTVNKLYVDMGWDKISVGEFLVVEAYSIINPATYPDVWKDRWLIRYATALIKRSWGNNLGSKFSGMELPGGVKINGKEMQKEAEAEIKQMEEEMMLNYSLPPTDLIM